MGKRKGKIIQKAEKPDLVASLSSLSIEEIDRLQKAAPMAFQSKLQAALNSNDAGEIMKANLYLGEINRQPTKIQSVFFDPNDISGNGRGFKDSKGVLSFSVLRRMGDIHIVKSIVSTRVEQIMNFMDFSEDEQKEGFTIRKKKSLFSTGDEKLTNEDKKKISKIVDFLEKGGWTDKWDNVDSLQEFVSKIMSDSLTLDQLAFEMVRNRMWELQKFRAVDASLIRFLDSVDPRQREGFEQYRFKGHLPRYCMVWEEMILHNPITKEPILYYPWELGFGIRNKTSDVRRNGYGVSELETLVNIITWILWGFEYNALFFSQGSQPKGFINIKNPNISNSTLQEFRQAWTQTMAGVSNCLVGETFIFTEEHGRVSLKDVVGDKKEKDVKIWTGKKFENATVMKTQKKKILKMCLNNGMNIECSPEHRFKVVSDNGVIEWKERKDIKLGDYVLSNKKPIEGKTNLFYKGKLVEDDLFEVIGWLIGDRWMDKGISKHKRCAFFFNSKKERYICENFHEVLNKYGINNQIKESKRTEKQIEDTKKRYGFSSVQSSVLRLQCCDKSFYKFLADLGFNASKDGKVIPSILFKVSSSNRCSFLRGFFSADGCTPVNTNNASITIVNNDLRNQMRLLLMMEGIQCVNCEGMEMRKSKLGPVHEGGYQLVIKNKKEFFERVSFIQDYKKREYKNGKNPFSVHPKMGWNLANLMRVEVYRRQLFKEDVLISKRSKEYLIEVGSCDANVSIDKIYDIAEEMNFNLPYEVKDFYFSKVIELSESDNEVEMYDVSVYDEEHQFIANGMLTHNSHRTPVINGIDLEWVDLQKLSNRDMEFNEWIKFLIIMTCSVYRIDPSELGFNFKESQQIFGQDGQRERLKHSREKGLKPLLIFLQGIITKYIVSELDENYEFAFTGIEVEDEEAQVKLDSEKLSSGMVSMQDIFKKYNGRDFDPEKDIILNQVYQGMKQAEEQNKMFGASQPGQQPEGVPENEEDPFAQYKSFNDNPIMKPAVDYYLKNLYK